MSTVNAPGIFSQNVVEFISRIEYRLATTTQEKQAIYRLRYDCYLREGAIRPNKRRLFKDTYDSAPNVWIFGIFLDGNLVSSVRIHVASREHPISPGVSVFNDVLGPRLAAGAIIVDPTRLVVDHEASRLHPYLAYATVRLGFVASEFFGADLGLATVRTEHRAFYKRLFFMQALAEPRRYPGLKKPINLLGIHYPSVHERIVTRYPFMVSTAAEREFLFGADEAEKRRSRRGHANTGHAAAA
jgi:hypothetical protein